MADTILITGASSDLGCALARKVLTRERAMSVIAHSYSGRQRIEELQAQFGERVYSVEADFSDPASVKRMADEISHKFDTPTQIIHLPALRLTYNRLTKVNLERFHEDMSIQVESAIILLQQFAAKMSKIRGSRVIFVLSSVVNGMPPKFMSMYTVVKYAQLGLMRATAVEYAGTHLTVNAVSPGMIETQFLSEIGEVAVQMSAAANPTGRNARPDDVLGAIDFLLSSEAGYITGVHIPIAGGSTC